MIGDLVKKGQYLQSQREAESDLLNGTDKLCECGQPGCGCPIITPTRPLKKK